MVNPPLLKIDVIGLASETFQTAFSHSNNLRLDDKGKFRSDQKKMPVVPASSKKA